MAFVLYILLSSQLFAAQKAIFSGHITQVEKDAHILKVLIDFENMKFLSKGDQVEFWNPTTKSNTCHANVIAKSNKYLLIKLKNYAYCNRTVYFAVGSYLKMSSPDLKDKLLQAIEIGKVLALKEKAQNAKLARLKKKLELTPVDRDLINKRYEVLKEKLELEWQQKLTELEDDKTYLFARYKRAQTDLRSIDNKLYRYNLVDQNLVEDRWALDSKIQSYEKKRVLPKLELKPITNKVKTKVKLQREKSFQSSWRQSIFY